MPGDGDVNDENLAIKVFQAKGSVKQKPSWLKRFVSF